MFERVEGGQVVERVLVIAGSEEDLRLAADSKWRQVEPGRWYVSSEGYVRVLDGLPADYVTPPDEPREGG